MPPYAPSHDTERLLVDGYNLIRAVPRFGRWERDSLQRARSELQKALREYIHHTGARIDLFYDGDGSVAAPDVQPLGEGLCAYFSCRPQLADDLIKDEVQNQHGAKRLRVISSDREIRNFARRHRVRSTASDAFDAELEQPPPRQKTRIDPGEAARRLRPPDEGEVDEWERLFTQERDKYVEDDEVEPYRPPAKPPASGRSESHKSPAPKQDGSRGQSANAPSKNNQPAAGSGEDESQKNGRRVPPVADRLSPRLNRQDIDEWERLFNEGRDKNDD